MRIFHLYYLFVLILNAAVISAQDIDNKYCSGHKALILNDSGIYYADPRLLYYDVIFYHVDLAVNDTNTYIFGFTEIHGRTDSSEINELLFELSSNITIDSIFLNGLRQFNYNHFNDLIVIYPNISLERGDYFTCRIYYRGSSGNDTFFSGISNKINFQVNKSVTYTLSEPLHAKDWFACKQVLNDKADSAYIFITVDTSLMAGSNGILSNIVNLPDGTHRFEWKTRYPIAFYLLSFSVSDYQDYSIYAFRDKPGDSLLIQNYIYNVPGYLEENRNKIDITRDIIELYSELFSSYPFLREKYGHCVAPMGGGMEHQTMTTLDNFNFYLVAHELAHQWFGDHVTCATWQDIWINEGFASYSEYLAAEFLLSEEDAQAWMLNAHERARTEPDGSIYIPAEEATNELRIFSGALSYKKGASILHMIRYELDNDFVFFKTLQNFQNIYKDSVATGLDFLSVLETTSGKDFSWFFDQWFFGKGYPNFTMIWWQEKDILNIASSQTGSSEETTFFRTHLDFLIHFYDRSDTLIRLEQTTNDQSFNIRVPGIVSNVTADPYNRVLAVISLIEKPLVEGTFGIFPNPFSDKVWVAFNPNNRKRDIIISDLNGKVLNRYQTENSFFTLSLLHLMPGIYLFTVIEGKEPVTIKILKE